MQIYLVGGAVRDQLLGLPVKERDWVVVGSTPEEMIKLGYRQVGKDFPVFLHPKTHEEYALARIERKVAKGYTGFAFDASPAVTLEEDLRRRDLTINAMAQATDGQLIDPYHGKEDLEAGILRHVSPAFSEDPVRILRAARFAARFGFGVAAETNQLMAEMVKAGEVDALVPERVWKELERGLAEPMPENFFQVLQDCGAFSILFPELNQNPEGLNCLVRAAKAIPETAIRFAILLHKLSLKEVLNLSLRYRIPKDFQELAALVVSHLPAFQKANKSSAEEIVKLLQALDAFRREERFLSFIKAAERCAPGVQSQYLLACYQAAKKVNVQQLMTPQIQGAEIAAKLMQARILAIQTVCKP